MPQEGDVYVIVPVAVPPVRSAVKVKVVAVVPEVGLAEREAVRVGAGAPGRASHIPARQLGASEGQQDNVKIFVDTHSHTPRTHTETKLSVRIASTPLMEHSGSDQQ